MSIGPVTSSLVSVVGDPSVESTGFPVLYPQFRVVDSSSHKMKLRFLQPVLSLNRKGFQSMAMDQRIGASQLSIGVVVVASNRSIGLLLSSSFDHSRSFHNFALLFLAASFFTVDCRRSTLLQ
jgi:acetolactate synthase regulatory subunit